MRKNTNCGHGPSRKLIIIYCCRNLPLSKAMNNIGIIAKTLFRNKGFLVNLKTETNASKFAKFMEKENPRSFFHFSFRATFIFPL